MSFVRRDFIKVVGTASVFGGLSAFLKPAMAASPSPALLDFGFPDDRVPMNAANLCPMPESVGRAYEYYATEFRENMTPKNRGRIEALREDARSRIATMLGTSANELALVRNTSEGNNVIVQGLSLDADDEILVWDQNHPSNMVAWDVRVSRSGGSVRRFSVPTNANSIDEVVDIFVKAVSNKTKVIAFTHISNSTGFRLPLAEICVALRKRKEDVHIHVDGAQTWGAVDLNLGAIDCDSFAASAHKWYMGPREVGLLYVRKRLHESIWPLIISFEWGKELKPAVVGARKFDSLGQRDDPALASLSDAARFHEAVTPAVIEQRTGLLADRLREGLSDIDVPFVSSLHADFKSNVVILYGQEKKAEQLVENVIKDAGVIAAVVGGYRMSPHIYNNENHVDRVIAAVEKSRHLLG